MKPIKIVFLILVSLILIIVIGVVALTSFMDPNDYKQTLITQTKDSTGLELKVDGDIEWRFLPNIGLTIGHSQINNPSEFEQTPMMEFNQIDVDIAFWPLLSKEIKIGVVTFDGFKLNIINNDQGQSNVDSLISSDAPETQPTSFKIGDSINNLDILGLQFTNAEINIKDEQLKQKQSFNKINFKLGHITLDDDIPMFFSAAIQSPELTATIKTQGQLKISSDLAKIELQQITTKIHAKGKSLPNQELDFVSKLTASIDSTKLLLKVSSLTASVLGIDIQASMTAKLNAIPEIQYQIKIANIDIDKILPNSNDEENAIDTTEVSQPLDLSWMNSFNAIGDLTIESVHAKGLSVTDISVPLKLKKGVLTLSPTKAKLYEGNLLGHFTLDGSKKTPSFTSKADLVNVNALPISKDLMDKEVISGMANLSFDLKGLGLDEESLKKNTAGNGKFSFKDGAIQGVNIAKLLRTAYAKIKGQTIEETHEPNQTDFASISGSFTLKSGLLKNPDLDFSSPLFRIQGAGTANVITEAVDYRLKTSVVGTLEGQGGKPITDLKNVSIPLLIKGTLSKPKFSLDTKSLMTQKLKNKVNKQKDKVKDKLKNKLKGLFGG